MEAMSILERVSVVFAAICFAGWVIVLVIANMKQMKEREKRTLTDVNYYLQPDSDPKKLCKGFGKIKKEEREDLRIRFTGELKSWKIIETGGTEMESSEKEEMRRMEFYLNYLNSEFPE